MKEDVSSLSAEPGNDHHKSEKQEAEPPPVYIVRQHAFCFVMFIGAGLFFCSIPWFFDNWPIWGRLLFLGMGTLMLAAGLLGWRSSRVGLAVDRRGVWCGGHLWLGMTLIPWDAILRAKVVTWKDWEGEERGVLMELRPGTEPPGGEEYQAIVRKHLERMLGAFDAVNPVLLSHDEWDWEPDVFVQLVTQCAEHPERRGRLGVYDRMKA